jgi:predicted nuclease of predicted toxin-antitoxin system
VILLDNCVPRRYLKLIQGWGYDTIELRSIQPEDTPDSQVIVEAKRLNAVLLTVDLDFSNVLNYPPQAYSGIVVMRYDASQEGALDETLRLALQEQTPLTGLLIVVSQGKYRVRRGLE